MKARKRALLLLLIVASQLSGCAGEWKEFLQEPNLSPVGAGLANSEIYERNVITNLAGGNSPHASAIVSGANLYTDRRIANVGDIVTVLIAINDKATFDNSTDRSKTTNNNFLANWNFANYLSPSGAASASSQPSYVSGSLTSSSSTQGAGNIDRQEQIQVSVAAIVTDVLPNGNLVVNGSQEVRVNYELRHVSIAGVIRPSDISRENTITYDRIAEARITYGGRGRLNDMQQPSWGQQLLDFLRPF